MPIGTSGLPFTIACFVSTDFCIDHITVGMGDILGSENLVSRSSGFVDDVRSVIGCVDCEPISTRGSHVGSRMVWRSTHCNGLFD